MNRRQMIAALAATTALPRVSRAEASAWAETEAMARREGAVTIYHNFFPSGAADIVAAFNAKYPEIAVQSVRLPSAQYYQRFAAECAAGKVLADVSVNALDETMLGWVKNGWIARWQPPEGDAVPATMWWDDRFWGVQVIRHIFVYNSRLIQRADAPFEWSDLFDPKWKGRIGLDEPWRSIGPLQCMKMLENALHIESAAKFKAQEARFFNGAAGVLQAVIRGDVAIGQLADLALSQALADGAPVRAVYPISGVTYVSNVTCVSQDAPHPNAARVLANWLMSLPGQIALQTYSGSPGVRADLPPHPFLPLNRDINAIDGRKVLSRAEADALIADWRRVFGVS
jgi:iron(III) transport system substrate-binding protein